MFAGAFHFCGFEPSHGTVIGLLTVVPPSKTSLAGRAQAAELPETVASHQSPPEALGPPTGSCTARRVHIHAASTGSLGAAMSSPRTVSAVPGSFEFVCGEV